MTPFLVAEIPYGPNGFTLLLAQVTPENKDYGESVLSTLPSIGEGSTKQAIFVSRLSRQNDSGREGRECLALVGVNVASLPTEQTERIQWKLSQLIATLEEETRSLSNLSRRVNVAPFSLMEKWESDLKVAELPGVRSAENEGSTPSGSFTRLTVFLVLLCLAVGAAVVYRGLPPTFFSEKPTVGDAGTSPTTNSPPSLGNVNDPGTASFPGTVADPSTASSSTKSNTPNLDTPKSEVPKPNVTAPQLLKPNQAIAFIERESASADLEKFVVGLAAAFDMPTQPASQTERAKIAKALVDTGLRWIDSKLDPKLLSPISLHPQIADALFKSENALRPLNGTPAEKLRRTENLGKTFDQCSEEIVRHLVQHVLGIWRESAASVRASKFEGVFPTQKDLENIEIARDDLLKIAQDGSKQQQYLLAMSPVLDVLKQLAREQVTIDCQIPGDFQSLKITLSSGDEPTKLDQKGRGQISMSAIGLFNAQQVSATSLSGRPWTSRSPNLELHSMLQKPRIHVDIQDDREKESVQLELSEPLREKINEVLSVLDSKTEIAIKEVQ